MSSTDFNAIVKSKYEWLSDSDVNAIVEKAKMFYYNLRYPSDLSVDEVTTPITGYRNKLWILSACDELVERLGFSSSTGYRENGISWSFDNAYLSVYLISQIQPILGTIGGKKDETT